MEGVSIGDWNIAVMVWAREGCGRSCNWVGDFGKSTSWGFACIYGLWIGWEWQPFLLLWKRHKGVVEDVREWENRQLDPFRQPPGV